MYIRDTERTSSGCSILLDKRHGVYRRCCDAESTRGGKSCYVDRTSTGVGGY